MASGSFSAMVVLELFDRDAAMAGTRTWNAIALGDSCVFHIRADQVLQAIPLTSSSQFNSRPYLISTQPDQDRELQDRWVTASGEWHVDDCFFLMSDALAAWFLKSIEEGSKPWRLLGDLGTLDQRTSFADLIKELRSTNQIRNDDVTLLRVNVDL